MRKIICFSMALLLVLSLAACGGGETKAAESSPSASAIESTSAEESIAPDEEKEPVEIAGQTVTEYPVWNGPKTKRIGTWARIYVPADEPDDELLTEICNDLEGLDYNWVTVDCVLSDGKGICFGGSLSIGGEYGTLTEDGTIESTEKIVAINDDGVYTLEKID